MLLDSIIKQTDKTDRQNISVIDYCLFNKWCIHLSARAWNEMGWSFLIWKEQNNLSWWCSSLKQCEKTGWEYSFRMLSIYTQKSASQAWEEVAEREMVSKYSSEVKTLPVEVRGIWFFESLSLYKVWGACFLHSSSQMDFCTNHRLWPSDSSNALLQGNHRATYKMWSHNCEIISLILPALFLFHQNTQRNLVKWKFWL